MSKQLSFTDLEQTSKKKQTRREIFLAEMDKVMPWDKLEAAIDSFYPKAGNGRRPYPLSSMLRIYCLQQWYALSDPAMEESLYEIASMRRFAQINIDTVPDETTLLNFRHLLEKNQLTEALFHTINQYLAAKGLALKQGTIVDATLINAPSSTKNAKGERDPDMHQTKKGNQWYFGMKVHIGVDSASGLVHSASVTAANVHDSQALPDLLHGQETRLYGDSAYRGKKPRAQLKALAPAAHDFTNRRAYKNRPLTEADRQTNRRKSAVRAKVEHVFRPLKTLWGFAKVRYRGLAKNANRVFAMLALINLCKWGRPLKGAVRPA